MQKLVHDDVVGQVSLQGEEFAVEVQASGSRAGGPLVPHRPNSKRAHPNIELGSPLENMGFELVFVAPPYHGLKLF